MADEDKKNLIGVLYTYQALLSDFPKEANKGWRDFL